MQRSTNLGSILCHIKANSKFNIESLEYPNSSLKEFFPGYKDGVKFENNVVNLPDSPTTDITFFSFFSGCPSKAKANLILFRPKLTDLLNRL